MQSVLTRARDQSRFEAPVIDGPRERRPFPIKVVIWILVAAVAIGIVAGAVFVNYFRQTEQDPNTVVRPTATNSQLVEVPATPQEVVTDYFTALMDGDIESALALGPLGGQGLGTLLTPEVYERTREIAPITDFVVHTTDPTATEIAVSYFIADRTIDTTVRLVRQDTGGFLLARSTVSVQLQVVGGDNLPVIVNGVQVDHSQALEVVPGVYEISTGRPFITFAENSFPVDTLASRDALLIPVSPQLTEEGRAEFLAAARASLDRCLSLQELLPTGCPFGIQSEQDVNQSTIDWSLREDPWQGVTPTLRSEDQSIAAMTLNISTRLTFTYATGDTSGNNDRVWTAQVSANMLGTEPSDVAVIWER